MLVTYLNTEPYTKFVLIKGLWQYRMYMHIYYLIVIIPLIDQLNERGKPVLNHIINHHIKKNKYDIHYFVYEGIYNRTTKEYHEGDIRFYNCVSNLNGWKNRISKAIMERARTDPYFCICPCPDYKEDLFSKFSKEVDKKSVIVIDSLGHLIYDYGFKTAYEMLTKLKNDSS